jgi:DNA polymerase III delta prime subunit
LKVEFLPISKELMIKRLEYICGAEGVTITESQLSVICDAHEGDLRNAINALQAFASFNDPIKATQFINSLTVQDFDSKLFLKLCVAERDMANASSMLNSRDTKRYGECFVYA